VEVLDGCRLWRCTADGRVGLIGGFGQWGAFKDAELHAIIAKRDEYKVGGRLSSSLRLPLSFSLRASLNFSLISLGTLPCLSRAVVPLLSLAL
jgi:hypothetical protein